MSEQGGPIRILIADDHPVVRHGLRSLLGGHHDLAVVGEVADGAEVMPWLADHQADVILLDIQMRGQNGLDTARRVRAMYPPIRIVILTTYDDASYLREALAIGVDGFLLKSMSHETLPNSIRAVTRGEKLLSPSLVSMVMSDYHVMAQEQARREVGLGPEELEMLAAMAEGASNKDLAERFFWSEATVKRKVEEIIGKLGTANRTQAVAEAIRRGWI